MTGYRAYQGNQVDGAGPLGLVLLTYEALYRSLGQARIAIESGDLMKEAEQTGRALEALIELSTTLDMEAGGEIARNLSELYVYMVSKITEHMCQASTAGVDEAMQLTLTLREGWKALEAQQQNEQKKGGVSSVSETHSQVRIASLAYAA